MTPVVCSQSIVKVTGKGNLKLFELPKIKVPNWVSQDTKKKSTLLFQVWKGQFKILIRWFRNIRENIRFHQLNLYLLGMTNPELSFEYHMVDVYADSSNLIEKQDKINQDLKTVII